MDEDKAGKATAYIPEINCISVWVPIVNKGEKRAEPKEAGITTMHTDNVPFCPNAGKKFKVATVELEEMC